VKADALVLVVHVLDTFAEEGLVPDAAVIAELGFRPACAATGTLVGSSSTPQAVRLTDPGVLDEQLDEAASRGRIVAARIGLLCDPAQVERVASRVRGLAPESTVLAPLLRAGGGALLDDATREALYDHAVPAARVLVLRAADLAVMGAPEAGDVAGMRSAAAFFRGRGARAVLITGAPARGRILDYLDDGGREQVLDASRIQAPHVAGLAGAHAVALACHLGRGVELPQAAEAAQRYVALRLQNARGQVSH
jgi:hydroxymethylpyrimidine/phosphomethylpyrimidine kinase